MSAASIIIAGKRSGCIHLVELPRVLFRQNGRPYLDSTKDGYWPVSGGLSRLSQWHNLLVRSDRNYFVFAE